MGSLTACMAASNDNNVVLFWVDPKMFFFLRKNFNIKTSEILLALHQKRMSFSKKITELYRSFDNDTKTELWDNKDNLRKLIKSKRDVLEKYAKGELGANVIFKHRAISSLELIDDLHNVIFSLALELLYEKSKNLYQIYKPFLNELKIFGILRKRNVFDYEKRYSHTFTYDFKNLAENNFAGFPKKLEKPIQITFYSNNEQKDMIKEKIIECGSNINGIGKILSKMLGTLSQRTLAFDDGTFSKQKNVDDIDINLYPGEFV